jgi:hypothetical protein
LEAVIATLAIVVYQPARALSTRMANEDLANVIHVTIAIIESSNATPRQEEGR